MGRLILIAAAIALVLSISLASKKNEQTAEPRNAESPKQTIDKSSEMQVGRQQLMEKLQAQGVFQKVEMPGNLPRLWIGPAFHNVDFETKQKYVSVVYAYYFNGSGYTDAVRIYDSKTGKEIGNYSISNPGLKMF